MKSSNKGRCIWEEDMERRGTLKVAASMTRRQAMAGGAVALFGAPLVIRSGHAQLAAVNIGVIQPLSGANAQFGINCRNGIELVADAINVAGGIKALGGGKINLVVSDATSRSEEHTSELQSLRHLVCRLLL